MTTETDRELLELSAKAIGLQIVADASDVHGSDIDGVLLYGIQEPWNPLTDDGDALRLAVKLEINVLPSMEVSSARNPSYTKWCDVDARNDPDAATRRAIVRAAAEIGKAMP